MNRFPAWKYALIGLTILLAFLFTLPNFFGEAPAVQISSNKTTVKVDAALLARVEGVLSAAQMAHTGVILDLHGLRLRFADADMQLKAKDLIEKSINPDPQNPSYVVALNLLSSSPNWLTAVHALPMYLGLDLRGGVHFLLQVDMQAAITKRLDAFTGDIRMAQVLLAQQGAQVPGVGVEPLGDRRLHVHLQQEMHPAAQVQA